MYTSYEIMTFAREMGSICLPTRIAELILYFVDLWDFSVQDIVLVLDIVCVLYIYKGCAYG
jgi:hypothetical protein